MRPVADLVSLLQNNISLWLDNPAGWTRQPSDANESRPLSIKYARRCMTICTYWQSGVWSLPISQVGTTAYAFSGTGSSVRRAQRMVQIYEAASPVYRLCDGRHCARFLNQVIRIVSDAVEEAGGSVYGVGETQPASVALTAENHGMGSRPDTGYPLWQGGIIYNRKDREAHIRMEAASQAIENTIQAVEVGLGIRFPRGSTPTEKQEHYAEYIAGQKVLTGLVYGGWGAAKAPAPDAFQNFQLRCYPAIIPPAFQEAGQ